MSNLKKEVGDYKIYNINDENYIETNELKYINKYSNLLSEVMLHQHNEFEYDDTLDFQDELHIALSTAMTFIINTLAKVAYKNISIDERNNFIDELANKLSENAKYIIKEYQEEEKKGE